MSPKTRLLRAIARTCYRVRGAGRAGEWIRRRGLARPELVWMDDFDGDLRIRVDTGEHMGSQIFWRGDYSGDQLRVLDRLLSPGDVFLDIGANIGEFTLFAAKRLPAGRVIAVEPSAALHERLLENVRANGFPNVSTHRVALSDREGEATLRSAPDPFRDGSRHDGLPSLHRNDGPGERVPVTTLDRLAAGDRLDVVKIDIEGSELPALRGGEGTLRRFRPRILIEVSRETSRGAGYEPEEIPRFLAGLGYRFQTIGPGGRLAPLDPEHLAEFQNVLCTAEGAGP